MLIGEKKVEFSFATLWRSVLTIFEVWLTARYHRKRVILWLSLKFGRIIILIKSNCWLHVNDKIPILLLCYLARTFSLTGVVPYSSEHTFSTTTHYSPTRGRLQLP